jgi:transcriptional regulator with XRE-family HTH domain
MTGRKKKGETEPKAAVELDRSFGPNLRRIRKKAGYSQESLGQKSEIDRTEIGRLERGEREPGFNVTIKLIGVLGISAQQLYEGATFVPPDEAGTKGHFEYADPKPKKRKRKSSKKTPPG